MILFKFIFIFFNFFIMYKVIYNYLNPLSWVSWKSEYITDTKKDLIEQELYNSDKRAILSIDRFEEIKKDD